MEVPDCICSIKTTMFTSWTPSNLGRRFARCSKPEGLRCTYWQWLERPLGRRAHIIIPGLLRRLNRAEARYENLLEELQRLELESSKPIPTHHSNVTVTSIRTTNIMNDNWEPDVERSLVDMLAEDEAKMNLKHDPQLVLERLEVCMRKLFAKHGKRLRLPTMRQKLEQLRTCCIAFGSFKKLPGVEYRRHYLSCHVDNFHYWKNVIPGKECPMYEHFRTKDCAIEDVLECIFNYHGVAELPFDLEGSLVCHVKVLDDEEARKVQVVFTDETSKQLDFDDSNTDPLPEGQPKQLLICNKGKKPMTKSSRGGNSFAPKRPDVGIAFSTSPHHGMRVKQQARRGAITPRQTSQMRVIHMSSATFYNESDEDGHSTDPGDDGASTDSGEEGIVVPNRKGNEKDADGMFGSGLWNVD